jgi:hypothetical protein
MSQAAKQLREFLETKYDDVRISRYSCRLTAGGSISQHSAYGGPEPYDSNALDIMGGPYGWTYDQNVALIQRIVDDLADEHDPWSIRLVLWKVPDHFGHAHIDFWPTLIAPEMWCNSGVTPTWEFSNESLISTKDPAPENGPYDGGAMSYQIDKTDEFDLWSDQNIIDAYDAGMFEDTNRAGFIDYWVDHRSDRTSPEKARFMTDYYAHLWKRGT